MSQDDPCMVIVLLGTRNECGQGGSHKGQRSISTASQGSFPQDMCLNTVLGQHDGAFFD